MASPLAMRNFRFRVVLKISPDAVSGAAAIGVTRLAADATGTPLCAAGFQEVSGLEVSMDVADYLEGGRNDGVIRRAGRARYAPLVLKRGMFYGSGREVDKQLWKWLQDVVAGKRPLPRYDGIVEVFGKVEDVVATWEFDRGLPLRLRGPELNGKTGDIAIEELHIAHEGLRLV